MVRKSPLFSWTRGVSITPTGATGVAAPRSTLPRVHLREVPTPAVLVWSGGMNGSHA